MASAPLTDIAVKKAKPGDKPVRIFDGRGLYIEIAPSGGKWWRWKYRFEGKERLREAWTERLPSESEAMFAELLAMPQSELLSLLAVCVASTVGAVCSRESETPAALLAQTVGLDMHAWWTPTAAGYFEHVSPSGAVDAAASEEHEGDAVTA